MTNKLAIIGAGITGCAIARELSKHEDIEVHLIEKEADVGWGVSKANTGIIHAGFDDEREKYPFRARLCKIGNILWRQIADELEVPTIWCGSLVLALDDKERKVLLELLKRGRENNVDGLKILDREDILDIEKNISDRVVGALWAPTSGVISPYEATIALAENAIDNDVYLHLETTVKSVITKNGQVEGVETDHGRLDVNFIINAAGIYGDEISRTAGIDHIKIIPRKGEYFLFDKDVLPKVNTTLFRVPTSKTKGVVITQTPEGNLLLGPNAKDLDENSKEDHKTTSEGLHEVWQQASTMVSMLPPKNKIMRTFAGLRPEPEGGDFIIKGYDELFGFIDVIGMRSPGLTAAPAVALEVVHILNELGVSLQKKHNWHEKRKMISFLREKMRLEQDHLISIDPSYGKVVCTCEMVTEAEIIEAIRRGAKTIDSIKFRTRAGMGRCQGSFCLPKIIDILRKNTLLNIEDITLKGRDSKIIFGKLRGDENT